MSNRESRFVAYLDEAGEDGIKPIRSDSANLGSEWFILSGILLRKEDDAQLTSLVSDIRTASGMPAGRDIHFVKMNNKKREIACNFLSESKFRWFSVISNKDNFRGHTNDRAKLVSGKNNALYNWMIRLILERMTEYCYIDNQKRKIQSSHKDLRVFLSSRGGLNDADVHSYVSRLWTQQRSGSLFLNRGSVNFDVFSPKSIEIRNNSDLAGLQVADVIASATYKALPQEMQPNPNTSYIRMLASRCASINRTVYRHGVLIMPTNWMTTLSSEKKTALMEIAQMKEVSDGPPSLLSR